MHSRLVVAEAAPACRMQWLLSRVGCIGLRAISCMVHLLHVYVHARQGSATIIVMAVEAHTAAHLRIATLAPERWSLHG